MSDEVKELQSKALVWFHEKGKINFPNWETDHDEFVRMTKAGQAEIGMTAGNIQRQLKKDGIICKAFGAKLIFNTKDTQTMGTESTGISEETLRARLDVLFQIREGIKKLTPGTFYTEAQFKESIVKTRNTGFKSKSELPEFDEYKGRASGIIYWGHPTRIKKLKEDNVLS